MKQEFLVEQAETRVDMKVSSRRPRHFGSEWYTDDTILVGLPASHFKSAARVAYCDALGEVRFATGLEFVVPSVPQSRREP